MKILQLELSQIDKIFNPRLLDLLTAPNGIRKNAEKYWMLSTEKQTNLGPVNQFLFAAKVNQYFCVMINKKAPN